MEGFKIETHLHTSESSRCGGATGAEMIAACKERGYSAAIVTDHFFNGNCAVPDDLPWNERVDRFCRGYENARKAGEQIGVRVFFGFEYNDAGMEFLVYNLGRQWLLSHENILSLSLKDFLSLARAEGGFVFHAHPFREAWYINEIRLYPEFVDGAEVFNGKNSSKHTNTRALEYANEHGLLKSAGSDAHKPEELICGCVFENEIFTMEDYIGEMRAGRYSRVENYFFDVDE